LRLKSTERKGIPKYMRPESKSIMMHEKVCYYDTMRRREGGTKIYIVFFVVLKKMKA